MNLAIRDADTFARAVRDFIEDSDKTGLNDYSDVCIQRAWNYQEYAVWVTDMLHDAGDSTRVGAFRQKIARARLERLFTSDTANRLYSEFTSGMN